MCFPLYVEVVVDELVTSFIYWEGQGIGNFFFSITDDKCIILQRLDVGPYVRKIALKS